MYEKKRLRESILLCEVPADFINVEGTEFDMEVEFLSKFPINSRFCLLEAFDPTSAYILKIVGFNDHEVILRIQKILKDQGDM